MTNPIKIADFKAILEKLESEGHTEISEIILEWEYSCDELPDVEVKDGKVYMYFHDTWYEQNKRALEQKLPESGSYSQKALDDLEKNV